MFTHAWKIWSIWLQSHVLAAKVHTTVPTLLQIEEYHLTRNLSSPYVLCLFNPTPGWLGNTKVEPRKGRFLLWRGTPETNMFFKCQLQKLPSSRNQPCKGGVFNKTSLKNHLFKMGGLMILMVSCPPKNPTSSEAPLTTAAWFDVPRLPGKQDFILVPFRVWVVLLCWTPWTRFVSKTEKICFLCCFILNLLKVKAWLLWANLKLSHHAMKTKRGKKVFPDRVKREANHVEPIQKKKKHPQKTLCLKFASFPTTEKSSTGFLLTSFQTNQGPFGGSQRHEMKQNTTIIFGSHLPSSQEMDQGVWMICLGSAGHNQEMISPRSSMMSIYGYTKMQHIHTPETLTTGPWG